MTTDTLSVAENFKKTLQCFSPTDSSTRDKLLSSFVRSLVIERKWDILKDLIKTFENTGIKITDYDLDFVTYREYENTTIYQICKHESIENIGILLEVTSCKNILKYIAMYRSKDSRQFFEYIFSLNYHTPEEVLILFNYLIKNEDVATLSELLDIGFVPSFEVIHYTTRQCTEDIKHQVIALLFYYGVEERVDSKGKSWKDKVDMQVAVRVGYELERLAGEHSKTKRAKGAR